MSRKDSSRGPRALAGVLAELARRTDPARVQEAVVRAALPQALGPWLHGRVVDVTVAGDEVVLTVADAAAAREVARHSREILRRLAVAGAWAPRRLRAQADPGRTAPRSAPPAPVPASSRPLVAQALAEVEDEATRRRLARWAGVDPDA